MEGKVFIRGNWLNRYGRKKGGGEPVEGLVVLAKKCADKSTGGATLFSPRILRVESSSGRCLTRCLVDLMRYKTHFERKLESAGLLSVHDSR